MEIGLCFGGSQPVMESQSGLLLLFLSCIKTWIKLIT